jgi:plasmid stability protein
MTFSNAVRILDVTHGSSTSAAAVEALTGAIAAELRLLEDLIAVMRGQRSCVAGEDLQGVDDSVFATHRILVTLGEARRQRRSLICLLGGGDDLPLQQLDDLLGSQMTDDLRAVRGSLVGAAGTLSREVEMNRQILRHALSHGGDLMREVYGAGEAQTYRPEAHAPERERPGGLLIDRQV